MKRIFTSFLTLIVFLSNWASTYKSDGLCYDYDEATMTTNIYGTNYTGSRMHYYTGETLIIPEKVNINGTDYLITEIKESGFESSPNLQTLVITAPITLGAYSFSECEKLKSITLPEGITEIPKGCFYNTAITEISSLPSTLISISVVNDYFNRNLSDTGAFARCTSLKSVTLPKSLRHLGDDTFSGCTNLTEANINENIVTIGSHCFSETSIITINLPLSLKEIHFRAFINCSNLSEISLPDSLLLLGAHAFSNTSISEIVLPTKIESIRSFTFRNSNISKLLVPVNVKRIMPAAFSGMPSLNDLIIADSQETLEFDYHASIKFGRDPWENFTQDTDALGEWFYGCDNIQNLYFGRNIATWVNPNYEFNVESRANEDVLNPFHSLNSLKTITIGKEVTDASALLFEQYSNLEEINLLSDIPPILSPLSPSQLSSVRIIVPEGTSDAYKNISGWNGATIIEESASLDNVIVDSYNTDTPVYNLQGIRVESTILPAGIYIKGGKKFIVH
ncbi:MAG: leucine-rich repeat domain-containing protein [Duncaniella sp.]|nr:leucine-rich repeat domain-containing protein [Duncaniella sp.]